MSQYNHLNEEDLTSKQIRKMKRNLGSITRTSFAEYVTTNLDYDYPYYDECHNTMCDHCNEELKHDYVKYNLDIFDKKCSCNQLVAKTLRMPHVQNNNFFESENPNHKHKMLKQATLSTKNSNKNQKKNKRLEKIQKKIENEYINQKNNIIREQSLRINSLDMKRNPEPTDNDIFCQAYLEDFGPNPQSGWSAADVMAKMFGMDKTISNMNSLAKDVNLMKDKLPEKDVLETFLARLPEILTLPGSVSKASTEVIDSIKSMVTHNALLLTMLISGYKAITNPNKTWRTVFGIAVAGFCVQNCIDNDVFTKIFLVIDKLVKKRKEERKEAPDEEAAEAQGFNSDDLVTLSTTVFHALSVVSLKRTPTPKVMEGLIQRLSNFKRTNDGISDFITWITNLFQSMLGAFKVHVLGEKYTDTLDGLDSDLISWCAQVEAMVYKSDHNTLDMTRAEADRAYGLMSQIRILVLKGFRGSHIPRLAQAVRNYTEALKKICDIFARSNIFGKGPRTEPLLILLRGGTGVGKSWLTMPFIIHLLKRVLPPEDQERLKKEYQSFVYSRQQEHKYWDGYIQNFVTVFDDFNQSRDCIGITDNEMMDLIRCANLFSHVCHMAGIEQKGNTMFVSKIIILTTNMINLNITSLNFPEALLRRFDLVCDVTLNPEYCLPSNSLKEELRLRPEVKGDLNMEIYHFTEVEMISNNKLQEYDYSKLLDRAEDLFRKKERDGNSYLKKLDEFVTSDASYHKKGVQTLMASAQGDLPSRRDIVSSRVKYRETLEQIRANTEALLDDVDEETEEDEFYNNQPLEDNLVFDSIEEIQEEVMDPCFWEKVLAKVGDYSPVYWLNLDGWISTNYSEIKFFEDVEQKPFNKMSNRNCRCLREECYINKLYSHPYDLRDIHFFITSKLSPTLLEKFNNDRAERDAIVHKFMNNPRLWKRKMYDWVVVKRKMHPHFQKSKDYIKNFMAYVLDECYKVTDSKPFMYIMKFLTIIGAAFGGYKLITSITDGFNNVNTDARSNLREIKEQADKNVASHLKKLEELLISTGKHTLEEAKSLIYSTSGQSSFSNKDKAGNNKNRMRDRRNLMMRESQPVYGEAQAAYDMNAVEISEKLINRSMYHVKLPTSDNVGLGTLIVVKGRVALMPRHYTDMVEAFVEQNPTTCGENLIIKQVFSGTEFKVPYSSVLQAVGTKYSQANDLCAFMLPVTVPPHKDVTNCFVQESFLNRSLDLDVMLVLPRKNGTTRVCVMANNVVNKPIKSAIVNPWTVCRALEYQAGTISGDCGAPAILLNKSIGPGKVISIHVAGHNDARGSGYGAIITREKLIELIEDVDHVLCKTASHGSPPDMEGTTPIAQSGFQGQFLGLMKLPKPVNRAMKTAIIPTKLKDCWGPARTKPVFLRPYMRDGEEVNPVHVAISKYGSKLGEVDMIKMELCISSYFSNLSKLRKPHTPPFEMLSFEDAVQGIVGVEHFEAIPRQTSAGFPYVLDPKPGFSGKQYYFGKGETYDLTSPQCIALKERVHRILDDAANGKRSLHVYVDCLKDERKPIEKVDAGKVRGVSCMPLELTIAYRMVIQPFCKFLMDNCIVSGCALGVNHHSPQWSQLAAYLSSKGVNMWDGDFGNMDGTHYPQILNAIMDGIDDFLGGDTRVRNIRAILKLECTHSIHVAGDVIYQWTRGLPSGFLLTTPINSIACEVYMRYAWLTLAPNPIQMHMNISAFEEYVVVVTFGDDIVVGVSSGAPFFTHQNVSRVLDDISIKFTTANKNGEVTLFKTLDDVSFLKRRFVFYKSLGRYLAPLELEVVLESAYWTKKNQDIRIKTISNVENTLLELSLHDTETYDRWAPMIIDASREKLGYMPTLITQAAWRERSFTYCDTL